MDELTPDQAISVVQDMAQEFSMPIPEDFQIRMAAVMLIFGEMLNSDCKCDACVRVRDTMADIV